MVRIAEAISIPFPVRFEIGSVFVKHMIAPRLAESNDRARKSPVVLPEGGSGFPLRAFRGMGELDQDAQTIRTAVPVATMSTTPWSMETRISVPTTAFPPTLSASSLSSAITSCSNALSFCWEVL